MSGKAQNVQASRPEANQDLEPDFTYEELLREVGKYGERSVMQAGDVSLYDIMKKLKVTKKRANKIIDDMVASGKYHATVVYNPSTFHYVRVVRAGADPELN
jgi:hypothetical protein